MKTTSAFAARVAWLLAACVAPTFAAPCVDHHQHLVSPAGAAWLNRAPLALDALPQGVRDLLALRVAHWNEPAALEALYAGNARVLDLDGNRWITSPAAVARYVGQRFARPYCMTAIAYDEVGDRAHLAGYFTRGEGADARHFGRYVLALRRDGGRWSIETETPMFPGPEPEPTISAAQLVAMLDEAGIGRAVVLSTAYWRDAAADVRAENDWTAAQVAAHPTRLVGFCSVDPLADYAKDEVARCLDDPRFAGVKLHLRTAKVDLLDAAHRAKLAALFAAVDAKRKALVVHVRTGEDYGTAQARAFVELVRGAPRATVQVAHLWGGEAPSDEALAVYAEAVKAGGLRNLWFDVSDVALVVGGVPELRDRIIARMREIGFDRLLYGSDAAMLRHPRPKEAWEALAKLPLSADEIAALESNVAPYLERVVARDAARDD